MHPNLIPVDVSNIGRLVEEMKQICRADPEEEEIPGSATVEGAYMRAVRVQQDIIESGHLRILRIDSRLVSTVLTLDRYTSPPRWDLSLSIPNFRGVEPFPVPWTQFPGDTTDCCVQNGQAVRSRRPGGSMIKGIEIVSFIILLLVLAQLRIYLFRLADRKLSKEQQPVIMPMLSRFPLVGKDE